MSPSGPASVDPAGPVGAVGLVVVSHSRALARAAIALAGVMLHGDDVRLEEAAGLDDGGFGTDAVRVADAIARADAGTGVVVLMDLGSAVLSAEVALDLLDPALRERVTLCPAPLVEGLCVAAVAAAGGADRHGVAAEARGALGAKETHLVVAAPPHPAVRIDVGHPSNALSDADADADTTGRFEATGPFEVTGRFEVTWPHGLHARPAAVLVRAVRGLEADVRLRNRTRGGEPVPAGSLSRVAALGAEEGHVVDVAARGPDAERAVERLLDLARHGFGDLGPASTGPGPATPTHADPPPGPGPLPASPGVAIGRAWQLPAMPEPAADDDAVRDPAAEEALLHAALANAEKDVRRSRDHTAAVAGEAEAAVFDAHLLLLDDPDLLDRARAGIAAGQGARAAWRQAVEAVAGALAALPDPYQRARADDVRAVGSQVEAHLAGSGSPHGGLVPDVPTGSVLVAPDLTPAQAATLDPRRVVAVVLAGGSPTAHSAILVRALGIPAVVGAGAGVLAVPAGATVAVDGARGSLVVDPSPDVRADYERRAAGVARRRSTAAAASSAPAVTRDGAEIHVGANLASVDDARAAATAGADLAGLVRTELVFLDRTTPPSVDEQAGTYRALADALPGRRIVVRTLDVGGDKPLPYLPMPPEANPFLGIRGLRLSLQRPGLLLDQLRAIVRVARERPLDVMFPMVTTVGELLAARRVLDDAVRAEGGSVPAGLRVGIMVEVPATALKAAAFAPHVDFFSIGTNDLTQYALAAERGNDAVAAIGDPLDPGLLALVAATARSDVPVAVCGELAADELATALLIGLGVRELSVSPRAVPGVKQAVREVDTAVAEKLAAAALAATDAAAVRALLQSRL